MENPAGKGGADLFGDDRHRFIKSTLTRPLIDDSAGYRALHLIHALGIRPELATMLAALAFGGWR